eukprot:233661_1
MENRCRKSSETSRIARNLPSNILRELTPRRYTNPFVPHIPVDPFGCSQVTNENIQSQPKNADNPSRKTRTTELDSKQIPPDHACTLPITSSDTSPKQAIIRSDMSAESDTNCNSSTNRKSSSDSAENSENRQNIPPSNACISSLYRTRSQFSLGEDFPPFPMTQEQPIQIPQSGQSPDNTNARAPLTSEFVSESPMTRPSRDTTVRSRPDPKIGESIPEGVVQVNYVCSNDMMEPKANRKLFLESPIPIPINSVQKKKKKKKAKIRGSDGPSTPSRRQKDTTPARGRKRSAKVNIPSAKVDIPSAKVDFPSSNAASEGSDWEEVGKRQSKSRRRSARNLAKASPRHITTPLRRLSRSQKDRTPARGRKRSAKVAVLDDSSISVAGEDGLLVSGAGEGGTDLDGSGRLPKSQRRGARSSVKRQNSTRGLTRRQKDRTPARSRSERAAKAHQKSGRPAKALQKNVDKPKRGRPKRQSKQKKKNDVHVHCSPPAEPLSPTEEKPASSHVKKRVRRPLKLQPASSKSGSVDKEEEEHHNLAPIWAEDSDESFEDLEPDLPQSPMSELAVPSTPTHLGKGGVSSSSSSMSAADDLGYNALEAKQQELLYRAKEICMSRRIEHESRRIEHESKIAEWKAKYAEQAVKLADKEKECESYRDQLTLVNKQMSAIMSMMQ